MVFCWFLLLFLFLFLLLSSFHGLIVLLFLEILVVFLYLSLSFSGLNWFLCLFFLLISVCLGAYGVSLLVSNSRGSGYSYFLSF